MSGTNGTASNLPPAGDPPAGVATPETPQISNPQDRAEWLKSIYISHADVSTLTVHDYLKTKKSDHELDSYWQDSHVEWALEFLRRKHLKHADVRIVATGIAAILHRMATNPGYVPLPDSQDYAQNFEPLRAKLEASDVVIIPVNNGYIARDLGGAAAIEQTATKDAPEPQDNLVSGAIKGDHWSFIVIDKRNAEQPIARYLDGMVRARRTRPGRNKWTISGIDINARAAGKVLCGFDMLLGLERGKFDARTLKFVPHKNDDNDYLGLDYGSCGPHMYALVDYVLQHKERLVDAGMDTAFNRYNLKRTRAHELRFHSQSTRASVADEIEAERRRQEVLQPGNAVDNLTPGVLRSMMTVDKLMALADVPSVPSGPTGGRPHPKGGNNNGGDGDGDDDDDGYHPNYESYRKDFEEAKANNTLEPDIKSLAQYVIFRVKQDSALQKIKVAIGDVTYSIPVGDKNVWKTPNIPKKGVPANTKVLPDFGSMTEETLKHWLKLNKDISDKHEADGKKYNKITSRALLHKKFKETFISESDESLQGEWIHDSAVFNPEASKSKLPVNEIRHMLMSHYEPQMLQHIKKYAISNAEPKQEDNKAGWPKGTTSLPNFAHLSDEDLAQWQASNPDITEAAAARPDHNSTTERALLHQKFHGGFRKTTPEDRKRYWVHDTSVFDASYVETLTDAEILQGLRERYEPDSLQREARMLAMEEQNRRNKKKGGPFAPLNIHGKKRKNDNDAAGQDGPKRTKP